MLTIGSIVMGARDLARSRAFWAQALDYQDSGDGDDTWQILRPRNGEGPNLSLFLAEATSPDEQPHVHLDLYAGDHEDQSREIDRLLALGAERVDWPHYPPDADFVVLADPEGNRFCVIDTGITQEVHRNDQR